MTPIPDGGTPGGSEGSAVVIGAGVIGLTAAVRLAQHGWNVRVLTAADPLDTTSAVAAALWYPYRANPRDSVLRWAARTMTVLTELAAGAATGVTLRQCREVSAVALEDPWWAGAVTGFRRLPPDRLPPQRAVGWEFTAPVAETTRYLPWLASQAAAAGVHLERHRVQDLRAVARTADVVVVCTGLGSRDLLGDDAVVPVRGQVVVVENPGVDVAWLDQTVEDRPTYIIPRAEDCVLGGTAQQGDWNLEPDPDTAQDITARCAELEPRVADAPILHHRVGLRPARPAVRLEAEMVDGRSVIYAYGHGGAGITLSWGCADDIVSLARSQVRARR